jgi:Ca2+-binding EF-hand superfamily protein
MKLASLFSIVALSLVLPAHAQNKDGGGKKQSEEKQKRLAERAERSKKREAVDEVLAEKDQNNDGSLTREEYLTGESDTDAANARFDEYNKNGDRYLSKKELEASLGL